jgi:TRAP-type C4-dicarboxylate transport system permease small subunit
MKDAIITHLTHLAATAYVQSCPQGADCDTGLPVVNAGSDQLQNILRVAFGILAAVAILFVVIGGLRYVISEGDPEATAKARGTIIYALVGLVIAITAEFLVAFVLNRL